MKRENKTQAPGTRRALEEEEKPRCNDTGTARKPYCTSEDFFSTATAQREPTSAQSLHTQASQRSRKSERKRKGKSPFPQSPVVMLRSSSAPSDTFTTLKQNRVPRRRTLIGLSVILKTKEKERAKETTGSTTPPETGSPFDTVYESIFVLFCDDDTSRGAQVCLYVARGAREAPSTRNEQKQKKKPPVGGFGPPSFYVSIYACVRVRHRKE